jgi:hypothetical protein
LNLKKSIVKLHHQTHSQKELIIDFEKNTISIEIYK